MMTVIELWYVLLGFGHFTDRLLHNIITAHGNLGAFTFMRQVGIIICVRGGTE